MIALRLVLDTSIVVSAALKPDGLQRSVLLIALQKPARLYVSDPILEEHRAVCPDHGFIFGRGFAGS